MSSVEVLSTLRTFRRTKKFCDIILKCGQRNYYAHCCVLAAVSPFYLAMFRSGMSEVHSPGMAFCLLIICLLLSFIIKRKIEK